MSGLQEVIRYFCDVPFFWALVSSIFGGLLAGLIYAAVCLTIMWLAWKVYRALRTVARRLV